MNWSAPITWLIDRINVLISANVSTAAMAIATTITPLVAICFGIYIMFMTINYMRGAESEPVLDFAMRIAGFSIVIGLGLNASNYTDTVIPIVTGIGPDIANAISGGSSTSGVLDELAKHYILIISESFEHASFMELPSLIMTFLKSIIVVVGLAPFLIMATITIIIANAGSVMVAMVGPIYFSFLLFPQTRQYASAWFNTALSYALIPIFVSVIATISVGISKEMLLEGGTLSDTTLLAVFFSSLGNYVMLFLLKQVSALASSLSAGGINAGMANGNALTNRAMSAGKFAYRGGKASYQLGKAAYQAVSSRQNSIRKAG